MLGGSPCRLRDRLPVVTAKRSIWDGARLAALRLGASPGRVSVPVFPPAWGGGVRVRSGNADACTPRRAPWTCVSLSGTEGPQATPPQTAVPPKSDLSSHFVSAEECLQLLPQRLREFFRVSGALSVCCLAPAPQPGSHLGCDSTPTHPGCRPSHKRAGLGWRGHGNPNYSKRRGPSSIPPLHSLTHRASIAHVRPGLLNARREARALLRELSPVQEAGGGQTTQARRDGLSQRDLQHAVGTQGKDPLTGGFLEEVTPELTCKPSPCAGQKQREQTVEEGAWARQAASRSWSSGKTSQLSVTGTGLTWTSVTEETGEVAAVQAQRQVQVGHSWVCVEK